MSAEQIYQAMMELPQKERFDLVARLLEEDVAREDEWRDTSFLRHFEPVADDTVEISQVRQALSKIPGSMSSDFRNERDERS
jgi:hypothetical protein